MNKETHRPLSRILVQFKEYYPIIFIYSILISLLTLATPISVQSLVSTFSFGPHFQPIFILSVILFGLLTLLGIIKSIQYWVVEHLQRKVYAKISSIISQSYLSREDNNSYSIDHKYNRYFDIILVYKNISHLVTDGISIAMQTLIGLTLISLYHPVFILFSIVILLAIILPFLLFYKSAIQSASEESSAKYEVADFFEHTAESDPQLKNIDNEIQSADKMVGLFLNKRSKHFKTVFTQNIIYVSLYALINASLLAIGGYLVLSNQLTIGQLVAAEIVVNAILSHFLYARKHLESFYDLHAAAKKLNIFYDHILEKSDDQDAFEEKVFEFEQKFPSIDKIYKATNYKKIATYFTGGVIVFCFLLAIVPWQQFSKTEGKVIAFDPNDRVQEITSPISGIVEEWLIQDGQSVKKGDPIVKVIDIDPDYMIRLESKRDAAVAKFEAAKEASNTARLNYHRQRKLVREGLSSRKNFEEAKIKYKKLQADEASAVASLAKAEVNLSRQQQQSITAPRDGNIMRILVGSGTTRVKAGQALVLFVPKTKETAVELFVDGNDLPLVYPGRKVRLQFEGWPAVQFSGWPSIAVGSFGGVVEVVDPSVLENGTFRILVKPDKEDENQWPTTAILRQGARVIGIINLDQVTIGYELWRQINGFPKSSDKPPKAISNGFKKVKK